MGPSLVVGVVGPCSVVGTGDFVGIGIRVAAGFAMGVGVAVGLGVVMEVGVKVTVAEVIVVDGGPGVGVFAGSLLHAAMRTTEAIPVRTMSTTWRQASRVLRVSK